jgi:hypothetical protein
MSRRFGPGFSTILSTRFFHKMWKVNGSWRRVGKQKPMLYASEETKQHRYES